MRSLLVICFCTSILLGERIEKEVLVAEYKVACDLFDTTKPGYAERAFLQLQQKLSQTSKDDLLVLKDSVNEGLITINMAIASIHLERGEYAAMENRLLNHEKLPGQKHPLAGKLTKIIIPEVKLTDVDFVIAIHFISQASVQNSRNQPNFATKRIHLEPIPLIPHQANKVSLDLKNASFAQVLTKLADSKLIKLSIRENAILVYQTLGSFRQSIFNSFAGASPQLSRSLQRRVPEINLIAIQLSQAIDSLLGAFNLPSSEYQKLEIRIENEVFKGDPFVNISFRNMTLGKVLDILAEQAGYEVRLVDDVIVLAPSGKAAK